MNKPETVDSVRPVVGRQTKGYQRMLAEKRHGADLRAALVIFAFAGIFLLTACNGGRSVPSLVTASQVDSVLVTFQGDKQLQHGYQVYRDYGCILCHGLNGEKGRKNPNAQTGEEVPSLTYVAEGFTRDEFQKKVLDGVSNVARKDPSGTIPPWRMPGWRGTMTKDELEDLTAYVWSLYPAGEEEEW